MKLFGITYDHVHYVHESIWRGERFFTATITSLIGISVAFLGVEGIVLSIRIFGSIVFSTIATFLSYVGRYVLLKERSFHLTDRYTLAKIRKALQEDSGFKEILREQEAEIDPGKISMKQFTDEKLLSNTGICYAFRMLYTSFAMAGQLVILLAVQLTSDIIPKITAYIFLAFLFVLFVSWFRSEIKSIWLYLEKKWDCPHK